MVSYGESGVREKKKVMAQHDERRSGKVEMCNGEDTEALQPGNVGKV